jgi:hypothetical protein
MRCEGQNEAERWLSWGDLIVVLTALLLALLGVVRHVRAAEREAPEPEVFPDAAGDLLVLPPDCAAPACDPRICHVLDPWGADPLWSGRAEALLLWRDNPQGLALFNNAPSAGGGSALNAADFGSGMAAGPRFTLFRHTGDQGAIEFNYFRVENFSSSKDLPTTAGGYVQSSHGIYCCPSDTPLNTVSGDLSAALQSFELNRRFPTDGGWQWLTGFRWVQWQENVFLASTTDFTTDTYDTGTWNDLYGWQGGADSILYGLGGPFRIEGLAKAGAYYNHAAQRSAKTTFVGGNAFPLSVGTNADTVAFVGEIGLTAVYDVYDWLSLRAGYAAFWLAGIATATNQLDSQNLCVGSPIVGRTDTGGSVVVQGITLGLEARY